MVCLQETHATSCAECVSWFSSYGFLVLSTPGSVHSSGVAILFRPTLDLVNSVFDSNGHFIMGHFKYHGLTFGVACVYAPNRNPDRNDFLDFCIEKIDPSTPTVIGGDFNTVFDRSSDRRGSFASDCSRESTLSLKSLFRECCVIDVWRSLLPTTIAFTWLRPDGLLSSRIDIIGCPSAWLHLVSSCDILPCPFSDHAAVTLNCALPEPIPRGPGRWKLNVSILQDPSFRSLIVDFWSFWRQRRQSFSSIQEWWERGKSRIKGLAISFCSGRQFERRRSRSVLTALATHLKAKIDAGTVSLLEVYHRVLGRIADLDQVDAEGARVHSRIQWAEEGESSSRFFLRLEKKAGADSWISAMRRPDGTVISDIASICSSWVDFYSDLFTAGKIDQVAQHDLLSNVSAHLPEGARDSCEGLLTVEEVHAALLGMAHNKSPGSDGLPMEFYSSFWDVLGQDLVEVLNSSLASGSLPASSRCALISLIFKKGDRLDDKNWRPISLLNVDYKLVLGLWRVEF